ncbi:hypothetical protein RHSIM_Rhsim01G0137900 [Rhododendron simsii]|uniref:Uncharacterized protein n=1 Tax=Rhododendron simsii TaxID=118357 RepID=A0A834HGC4_RHOSS|nr:hypothetical protein RHSIM_Rhsim01G0137900 [Rhododendron simsii]
MQKEYLGFEIFAEDTRDSDDEAEKREELVMALHVDWVEAFDQGSLRSLFGDEKPEGVDKDAPVLMLEEEDICENPFALIVGSILHLLQNYPHDVEHCRKKHLDR